MRPGLEICQKQDPLHSGLGKLGKDYWVTENQELLLLVMVCICEAGTVVQSALGGRSLELPAEKILKPGITMSPFVATALDVTG